MILFCLHYFVNLLCIWDIFCQEWKLSKICNTNNVMILWIKDFSIFNRIFRGTNKLYSLLFLHTTLGWCISQQCFYFRSPGQVQRSPSWLCKKLFKKIKIQQIQFVMWQLAGFNYLSTYYVSYLLECFYYNYPRGHFHSHGQTRQSPSWICKKLFKKIKIQQSL